MRVPLAARPSTWILLGIAALCLCLLPGVRTAMFVSRATEAKGVVTALTQINDSSEWELGFSFTAADGVAHAVETTFMSPRTCPALRVGDEVVVLYDRDAPSQAAVRSFATLWFKYIFFLAIGVFFLGGGAIMALVARLGVGP